MRVRLSLWIHLSDVFSGVGAAVWSEETALMMSFRVITVRAWKLQIYNRMSLGTNTEAWSLGDVAGRDRAKESLMKTLALWEVEPVFMSFIHARNGLGMSIFMEAHKSQEYYMYYGTREFPVLKVLVIEEDRDMQLNFQPQVQNTHVKTGKRNSNRTCICLNFLLFLLHISVSIVCPLIPSFTFNQSPLSPAVGNNNKPWNNSLNWSITLILQ